MENENNNIQQQPLPGQPQKSDGLAIASMILGISAVLFTCCYGVGFFPGIVGLILGIIAKSKNQNKGFALTGIITSGIAILFGLIVFCLFIFVGWAALMENYMDPYWLY